MPGNQMPKLFYKYDATDIRSQGQPIERCKEDIENLQVKHTEKLICNIYDKGKD